MLDMGAIEQNIAKQAMLAGAPMPDRIANAPELKQGLELYLQAFFDLDSERNNSMGPSFIPWSKMLEYAKHYLFDEEQTENLFFFIRQMDSAHLKRLEKKSKKA
jgi:hypothetical protein